METHVKFHLAVLYRLRCNLPGLLAAISITGYIPTSGDTTFRTIEQFDLENMGTAIGIFFLVGTATSFSGCE